MHIFPHFRFNPAGRMDVVGGPHAARGPQVARDCNLDHRQNAQFVLQHIVFIGFSPS